LCCPDRTGKIAGLEVLGRVILDSEITQLQKFLATQPVKEAFLFGSVARDERKALK
jgi:hypothetical protein